VFDFATLWRGLPMRALADEATLKTPYAGKNGDEWIEGGTSIQFLNDKFRTIQYSARNDRCSRR
jgi:hypothetical protein